MGTPFSLTKAPIRVTGVSEQDPWQALDIGDCDDLDVFLWVIAITLPGPAPTFQVQVQTSMQNESADGWTELVTFTMVTATDAKEILRGRPLRFIRWKVTTFAGISGDVTFSLDGMSRRWRVAPGRAASRAPWKASNSFREIVSRALPDWPGGDFDDHDLVAGPARGSQKRTKEDSLFRAHPRCGDSFIVQTSALGTALQRLTCIDLGATLEATEPLRAWVPLAFTPVTPRSSVWTIYLRDAYVPMRLSSPTGFEIKSRSDRARSGLYWVEDSRDPQIPWLRDGDYYASMVGAALALLYGHAEMALTDGAAAETCRFTPSTLRDRIMRDSFRIDVDDYAGCAPSSSSLLITDTGQIHGARTLAGLNAQNLAFPPYILICDRHLAEAAIADIYLFWSHRLHAYAIEVLAPSRSTSTLHYIMMADLCARVALSQIASLSGLLLHEMGHDGISPHCARGNKFGECCHDRLMFEFWHTSFAEFGLPPPYFYINNELGADPRSPAFGINQPPRFPGRFDDPWADGHDDGCSGSGEVTHSDLKMFAKHCALVRPRHRLEIDWTIDPLCTLRAFEGQFVWRPNDYCLKPVGPISGVIT